MSNDQEMEEAEAEHLKYMRFQRILKWATWIAGAGVVSMLAFCHYVALKGSV